MDQDEQPKKRRGFGRHLGLSLVSQAVLAICQAAVILIVAHLGTPEQVGYITLATALIMPVYAFASLAMRMVRSVDGGDTYSYAEYLALRLITLTIALAVIVGILLARADNYPTAFSVAALAILAARTVQEQSQLNYGVMQSHLRMDLVARGGIARGILGLIGFTVGFVLTRDLAIGFVGQAIGWLTVALTVERRGLATLGISRHRSMFAEVRLHRLWVLFLWLLPMGMNQSLNAATLAVPRLVLAENVTFLVLGLFGAIAYLETATRLIVVAIAQSTASWQANHFKNGRKTAFFRTTGIVVTVNVVLSGVLVGMAVLFGEQIIRTVFGAEFVNQAILVPIVMAIALNLMTSALAASVVATRRFWLSLSSQLVPFIVVVIAAFAMIPNGGGEAAATVILIGAATRLVMAILTFLVAINRFPTSPLPR